ncbi:thioester reductase domain-containing protein [Spirulina sp. 06S082]|uniref:thioester reductase domain-containing protein n=1 Tax=Spirulina sp. 06S082 TaxID=3110248 RepID=UPI002B21CC1A|nr:thioester reductase domain-containing protein [Spirulina sp. 06S082]MEA5469870.1 thioester reductase domain-containing protein [Spirulina sp. 06S082]
MESLNLQTEAVLDPSIRFDDSFCEYWLQPQSILLTGATGFLGSYLLKELLQKTQAKIYCLVRCSDFEVGKERIKAGLDSYLLWEEELPSRIIPVMGDLSKPFLGLSQEQFKKLGDRLDVIYHNGAWVNSFYPYSTLKPTNVLGTQEVLRLAGHCKTKPVHFISTVGVFFGTNHSPNNLIKETDSPQAENLKGGYKQSKWVAEQLIITAKNRGLPACIYRPGRIMGDSKTGIINNLKDLLYLVLKACITIRQFPAVETTIDIVPVDYVSQAIVYLSQQKKSLDKIFHILNPQPIAWGNLIDGIQTLGYDLEETSYNQWLNNLKSYAKSHNDKELYSISRLFFGPSIKLFSSQKPLFDTHQTRNGLVDTSIVCPPVDRQLLSTYFSYFQKRGFIPALDYC